MQGVFYRSSAQRYYLRTGGWANLSDGRVELLACGEASVLAELEKWLEIGPEYAKVTNIEVIPENPSSIPAAFNVLPTV